MKKRDSFAHCAFYELWQLTKGYRSDDISVRSMIKNRMRDKNTSIEQRHILESLLDEMGA